MNAMADQLGRELRVAFPGHTVGVSLTEAGAAAVAELGTAWVLAALVPLVIARPGDSLEVSLSMHSSEPMHVPPPYHAAVKLGPVLLGGMITLHPSAGRGETVRRLMVVPTAELVRGEGSYTFVEQTRKLKRLLGGAYGKAYNTAPVALDRWKQWRTTRGAQRGRTLGPSPLYRPWVSSSAAPAARPERRRTLWVAMHWLEGGGAEAWALEQAQLAAAAGREVLITVDRSAPQRILDSALAITPHVHLLSQILTEEDGPEYVEHLLDAFDIRELHIHHSAFAYGALPRLRHLVPDLHVVDTTHIEEHRGGGFVKTSLKYSDLIDLHHVISPELRDRYLLDHHIATGKVVYRPLTGLAEQIHRERGPRADTLRVGFLGRLAPQKRPFLFIELARRLQHALPGRISWVMQGSGVLDGLVAQRVARYGLQDVIQRRAWGPTADFFRQIDVLVISSDNEGLTLTSLEADAAGVLVVSTDVGSQRTVVPPDALLPREPGRFLAAGTKLLRRMAEDPGLVDSLLAEQGQLVGALRREEPAVTYFKNTYKEMP